MWLWMNNLFSMCVNVNLFIFFAYVKCSLFECFTYVCPFLFWKHNSQAPINVISGISHFSKHIPNFLVTIHHHATSWNDFLQLFIPSLTSSSTYAFVFPSYSYLHLNTELRGSLMTHSRATTMQRDHYHSLSSISMIHMFFIQQGGTGTAVHKVCVGTSMSRCGAHSICLWSVCSGTHHNIGQFWSWVWWVCAIGENEYSKTHND